MDEEKKQETETSAASAGSRRQRWKHLQKERRIQRREARKAYYAEAPALTRAWHLWLKKAVILLLILSIVGGAGAYWFYACGPYNSMILEKIETTKRNPVDPEVIYANSPIDEAGAARIDAQPAIDAEETWGIYVYMVGADLEDSYENDLSDLAYYMTAPLRNENLSVRSEQQRNLLNTFADELAANGLDMPEYLYQPNTPVASSTYLTDDVVVAENVGAASADIAEMTSGVWRSGISLVIQTGGATHWTNSMVNPNKTQRFAYQDGVFSEVANLPLQDSCAPETLSDFLRFCNENYPADHKMVILWDHGSGAAGYGHDSIFGTTLTLEDLRNAFSAVYTPDTLTPAIDILGFDACLMASAEVAERFDGFAKYLVASEELEPGDGWDYGVFLQAMTDNPSMSAAQVSRAIVDSYTDYYMTYNENCGRWVGNQEVTMSVLDVRKATETYRAYADLCAAQLKDAAADLGVLAQIGSLAGRATRYGSYVYEQVNAVDLGGYMDLLADSYPEESQKVRTLLKEAVLYHRQNGTLSESQGLSVYIPIETKSLSGLLGGLDFIYNVCQSADISALYYYKLAGCLNEEMAVYTRAYTSAEPLVLDVSLLQEFSRISPVLEDGFWSVPVSSELLGMTQDRTLELAHFDADSQQITYYGRDEYVAADGDGSLVSAFDGQWIVLDGVFLSTEVVGSTETSVSYRSKVRCDGTDYYLMFTYDRDSEEFTIGGLKEIQTGDDTVLMLNTRQLETTLVGKTITPVYEIYDTGDNSSFEGTGDKIKIRQTSKITLKDLPNGSYLSSMVITDPRGDSYYSAVVKLELKSGKVAGQRISTDFYGTDR